MNLDDIREFVRQRLTTNEEGYVAARESTKLDFKESFIWGSYREDYLKTMVAFANNKGGFLLFGVRDRPHEIVGLQTDNFRNATPESVAEALKSYFSSVPDFEMEETLIDDKKVGWLYVYEHENKPIVCTKTGGGLKDGDIYYRHGARSERITSTELLALIDERREKEQQLWFEQFRRVAKFGVQNAAVLNVDSGEIEGAGGKVIIDAALLPQLKFIKEGEFSEREGAPTLRLVGEITGTATLIERRIDPEIQYPHTISELGEKLGFEGSTGSKANNARALVCHYNLQTPEYMHVFKPYANHEVKRYNNLALDYLKEKLRLGEFDLDPESASMGRLRRAATRHS